MNDTNNTVLTDEEIRHKWEAHTPQLCHPGSLAHGFARAVERAVIAKLPGMPAGEFLTICREELERSTLTSMAQKYEFMRRRGMASIVDLHAWMHDTRKRFVEAVKSGRIQPAASEAEKVLARFLAAHETGSPVTLEMADAARSALGGIPGAMRAYAASEAEFKNFHRALCERFDYCHDERDWKRDQVSLIEHIAKKVVASEAGAVPVYYRYRHSANEKWHYGPTPQSWWECKALYAAPPAQPQDAGAVPNVYEIQQRKPVRNALLEYCVCPTDDMACKVVRAVLDAAPPAQPETQAGLREIIEVFDPDKHNETTYPYSAAQPAPSQQAAPAAESAEPVTGGTVSELLDAIRHYGSEKWAEGNRHAIAVGDDRKSIRAAWDDVYRLVQLLAAQPTAATADAQGDERRLVTKYLMRIAREGDGLSWETRLRIGQVIVLVQETTLAAAKLEGE